MVIDTQRMTAEQFAAVRHELADGGRWHELHEGRPVLMQPPDDHHGTTVLNLSRALALWFQQSAEQNVGYACHQVGLQVESDPDTVYFPAISFFSVGQQFEEADNTIATKVPQLVIDVASANDRRSEMRFRTLSYMKYGVQTIWVPDPMKKEVQVIQKNSHTLSLGSWQTLEGANTLPNFSIKVADVFAQPEWWTGKSTT